MSKVIDLQAHRESKQPHWSGEVYCVGCQHTWVGVAPIGTEWVDCPSCSMPKGTPRHPFGGTVGDAILTCTCGCEALTAYKREGAFCVRCMKCGNNLTEAFYN